MFIFNLSYQQAFPIYCANFHCQMDKNHLVLPLRKCCSAWNKRKSDGVKSSEYGGRGNTSQSNLLNCSRVSFWTVQSCIIVLQTNFFSIANRWLLFIWILIHSGQLFAGKICIFSLSRFQRWIPPKIYIFREPLLKMLPYYATKAMSSM